jgi:hypothetical protein
MEMPPEKRLALLPVETAGQRMLLEVAMEDHTRAEEREQARGGRPIRECLMERLAARGLSLSEPLDLETRHALAAELETTRGAIDVTLSRMRERAAARMSRSEAGAAGGRIGGPRVRELIARGKQVEGEE